MNKEVAAYIFYMRYHLKNKGIRSIKRMKPIMVRKFVDSGEWKKYSENSFRETWDELIKLGML